MPPPRLVVDRQPRLQPTAAGQGYDFRSAAHAAVAPLAFDAEELELAQPLAKQEIKRLALWSAIPGIALFGAVLVGRVLLAGPAPEQAPSAIVAPVEVAPAVVADPVQPEQAPSTLAPPPAERRARTRDASASASASRTRTHATHEDVSSDDSASASPARAESTPRATHSPAATADEPKAAPVERTSGIGILRLNSRPWSQVFVDGKLVGNTPQMGLRLNAGSHRIELVNPQLGMSKKFKVEVQADEIVTRSEMLEE
jgi:serine/threonine-protein kinase